MNCAQHWFIFAKHPHYSWNMLVWVGRHPHTSALIRRDTFVRSQDFWAAQNFGCGWHPPYIRNTNAIHTQYTLNLCAVYPLLSAVIRNWRGFDSGLGQCVKRIYSVPITSTSRTKIMCSECIQLLRLLSIWIANNLRMFPQYMRYTSAIVR